MEHLHGIFVILYTKLKFWVYAFIYLCLFAYNSRNDKQICTKFGMLIPWDQVEKTGGSKLRKSVLSSIPDEGGSCSSETKHDRRTGQRLKLFA
jgi:hypothetical protein